MSLNLDVGSFFINVDVFLTLFARIRACGVHVRIGWRQTLSQCRPIVPYRPAVLLRFAAISYLSNKK